MAPIQDEDSIAPVVVAVGDAFIRHTEPLANASRSLILGMNDRDQTVRPRVEGMPGREPRCAGRISMPPGVRMKMPPDLELIGRLRLAGTSDALYHHRSRQLTRGNLLDGPVTANGIVHGHQPVKKRFGLSQVPHHRWPSTDEPLNVPLRIHVENERSIRRTPGPECNQLPADLAHSCERTTGPRGLRTLAQAGGRRDNGCL